MASKTGMPAVVALLALLLAVLPVQAAGAGTERWVVRFEPSVPEPARMQLLTDAGLRPVDALGATGFVLATGGEAAAHDVAGRPGVLDVRAPQRLSAAAAPNDPLFPSQWHLPAVQVPEAWELSRGAGVTVAVLDTGVDRTLSDLAGVRFAAGFDFVNGDTDPTDDNGHGSHVAGTIAQATGNGIGGAGVAPDATIMPLKVLDGAGAGDDWNVAQGLHWAADNGATVVNLSLGGPTGSLVLEEAVNYAFARGVTVVAASGNQGGDAVAFPAAYPAAIAVGAVRYDRTRAPYSNRGPALDLVAPGGDLTVDQNGDGWGDGVLQQTVSPEGAEPTCFCLYEGTSMATPHVAGVAALLAAAGTRDPAAIREALVATAVDGGPAGRDDAYGHGLVQARAALEAAPTIDPDAIGLPPAPTVPGAPEPDPPDTEEAPGGSRDLEDVCPSGEVPEHGYDDVAAGSTHEPAIACMSWYGIVSGVAADRYAPTGIVRRDQMAALLARLLEAVGVELPRSPPDAFDDDDRSVHARRIDQLAAVGIVSGTVDGTFAPATPVTRAQMATFLVRTVDHALGEPINPRLDQFDDDDGNAHEPKIDAVATVGVAAGTGFRAFSPGRDVRRDQIASFLARALDYLADNGRGPA